MGKPLEMRGWAVKHTAPDGKQRLVRLVPSRRIGRIVAAGYPDLYRAKPGRYTVVPVIVRERR